MTWNAFGRCAQWTNGTRYKWLSTPWTHLPLTNLGGSHTLLLSSWTLTVLRHLRTPSLPKAQEERTFSTSTGYCTAPKTHATRIFENHTHKTKRFSFTLQIHTLKNLAFSSEIFFVIHSSLDESLSYKFECIDTKRTWQWHWDSFRWHTLKIYKFKSIHRKFCVWILKYLSL